MASKNGAANQTPPATGPTRAVLRRMRVLAIGTEAGPAGPILAALESAGMQAAWLPTPEGVAVAKRDFAPDLVLLDLAAPNSHARAVLGWLAGQGDCGIVVLLGAEQASECEAVLELGADDCMTHPVRLRELAARLRAVRRRASPEDIDFKANVPAPDIRLGDCRFDLRHLAMRGPAGGTALTPSECAVLGLLLAMPGQPVARTMISEMALARRWIAQDRAIDQIVLGLRRKLAATGTGRCSIQAIRGGGYFFAVSAASPRKALRLRTGGQRR